MLLRLHYLLILTTLPFILFCQETRSTNSSIKQIKQTDSGKIYAVVVGISAYKSIQPLNYAADDAKFMYFFLTQFLNGPKVPKENVLLYLDKEANWGNLTRAATKWLNEQKIGAGDKVIFYLAGHGDSDDDDQFFLTYEYQKSVGRKNIDIEGNLELSRLKKWLRPYGRNGAEVILIVDACRTKSNEKTDSGIIAMNKNFYSTSERTKSEDKGLNVFYAAKDGSYAFESSDIGHGLFTYYFVIGASGEADQEIDEDGNVTYSELFKYLQNTLPKASKQKTKGQQQIPLFNGDDQSNEKIFFKLNKTLTAKPSSESLISQFKELLKKDTWESYTTVISRSVNHKPSELIRLYNEFLKSLNANNLIAKNASALKYFYDIERRWPNDELTEQAKSILISSLLNFSKASIVKYLLGIDNEFILERTKSRNLDASQFQKVPLSGADFTQPSECLRVAIQLADNSSLTEYLYPRLLFLQARSYFNTNSGISLESAISKTEEALKLDTAKAHLYHLLAMLEGERGNIQKATLYLNKAIFTSGIYNKSSAEIGHEFLKMNRYQEASLYYRLGTMTSSHYSSAYNNLGILSDTLGLYENAERFFKLAIEKENSKENINNLSVFYKNQATRLLATKDFKGAEHKLILAAKIGVKDPNVFYRLGNLYAVKEQWLSARNSFLQSLKIRPDYTIAIEELAVVYYHNKFFDSCIYYSTILLKTTKKGTPEYNHAVRMITNSNEGKKHLAPKTTVLLNKKDPEFIPEE